MLGGSSTNQINSNKMVSNQVGKRIKNTFFVSCSIPWPSTCFTLAQGVKKNFASNTFQFKSSWFVELPPGNQSSLDTLIESLYTQIKNTFYKYDGWMLPQCFVRVWTLWGWFFVFLKPWVLNYEKNYFSPVTSSRFEKRLRANMFIRGKDKGQILGRTVYCVGYFADCVIDLCWWFLIE